MHSKAPETKLKRVRVKKAEEGGSVERLKASLEKGKLLCGLGSGALCVACLGLRYLHRIRKVHVYAIFVSKRSADVLRTRSCIHQCDQIL